MDTPSTMPMVRYGVVGEEGWCQELGEGVRRWTFPGLPWGAILEAPAGVGADEFRWSWKHARVVALSMMDQTDRHNELVWEREWLVWPAEAPFTLTCPVLAVEDVFTGEGRVFLRLAPLPHARSGQSVRGDSVPSGVEGSGSAAEDVSAVGAGVGADVQPDFEVLPREGMVRIFRTGYAVAESAYAGGEVGRMRALHAIQRMIRRYEPGRDGQFLSNTWGDRSRDACIHESFLRKEIEVGARLGVDVVEIDDGWQTGKTANAASVAAGIAKGAWDGYWAFDEHFWEPNRERFPQGLEPVVTAARELGLRLGLWFGPDSSREAAQWERDANRLLELHREEGIDFIKIDSLKTHSALALRRQRMLFDRVLKETEGRMVIDLDVTAELRPGYFGLPDVGTLFVENRYTDWHNYWPHQTLRNVWSLSRVVDPIRLRMEVLNPLRNQAQYAEDPLGPAAYSADTLFAITMVGSPLGWFEMSNLAEQTVRQMRALVDVWKQERARFHGGNTIPIGQKPDGCVWTGFVTSDAAPSLGGYVLLFRERNPQQAYLMDLAEWLPGCTQVRVLAGRGEASLRDGLLQVVIPQELDFLWIRVDGSN